MRYFRFYEPKWLRSGLCQPYGGVPMLRITIIILAVISFFFPSISIATPVFIEENNKGITLRVNDVPLSEVLRSIENQTGIHFHASPSVSNDWITIELKAPDWQTAMKFLLEPYGRMEMWGPRLDMTEIYILSRTNEGQSYSSQRQQNLTPSHSGAESPLMLTKEQYLKIVSGSYRAPLSPELLDDPDIRSFLNQNGVNSPEDLKDTQKIKNIRIEARRQMRQLQKTGQN